MERGVRTHRDACYRLHHVLWQVRGRGERRVGVGAGKGVTGSVPGKRVAAGVRE